jgi:hypothetical protein
MKRSIPLPCTREAHFTPEGRFTCEAYFAFREAEYFIEKL